ncbi:zincin-like metallopeptidase domain-containing protein [Leptospira levettii]|uniref:zincin-like metallopeptidase domain-containing protein n=1 Tax=Leptospira levettii TaxID=2023178 RepID=UPI0038F7E350
MNRDFSSLSGSYTFEELIAELCSALFTSVFVISENLQHNEYICLLLHILNYNSIAFFKAGWLKEKPVDYLSIEPTKE